MDSWATVLVLYLQLIFFFLFYSQLVYLKIMNVTTFFSLRLFLMKKYAKLFDLMNRKINLKSEMSGGPLKLSKIS